MKIVLEFLEDVLIPIVAVVAVIGLPFWLLYKILAGIYHLLILLINKA